MEQKTPQGQRVKYTGRFATEADSKPPRAAAPVRPRAANAQSQSGHRPSGFAPAEPPKRRTAPRPAAAKAPERPKKREKNVRNKRAQGPKYGWGWKLPLLIALAAVILLTVILLLIFGGRGTHHQLPKVVRDTSAEFTAAETNAPEETDAPQLTEATAEPAMNEGAAFDGEDGFNEADFLNDADLFGGAEDFDAPSFFDGSEDADILNELLALQEANP